MQVELNETEVKLIVTLTEQPIYQVPDNAKVARDINHKLGGQAHLYALAGEGEARMLVPADSPRLSDFITQEVS
jgi:hypothetical protein